MLATRPSHVRRLDASDARGEGTIDKLAFEIVRTSSLNEGDFVLCVAGDVIPIDGVVVEGRAVFDGGRARDAAAGHIVVPGAGCRVSEGMRLTAGYLVISVTTRGG